MRFLWVPSRLMCLGRYFLWHMFTRFYHSHFPHSPSGNFSGCISWVSQMAVVLFPQSAIFFPTNLFIFNVDFTFSIIFFFFFVSLLQFHLGWRIHSFKLSIFENYHIDWWLGDNAVRQLYALLSEHEHLGSDQSTTGLEINAATGHRSGCASVI